VAMLAYTGVETVSNLAEEVRDPVRSVPNAYKLVAGAVFAIYFTLPMIALSAMPVTCANGEYSTVLGLNPPEGYANEFVPRAAALIKAAGGRYVAAGGVGSSGKVTGFDGDPPKSRVVIHVWDSLEQIQAWYNSPEYKEEDRREVR